MNLPKRNIIVSDKLKNTRALLLLTRQFFAAGLIAFLLMSSALPAFSQTRKISGRSKGAAERAEKAEKRIESRAKTNVKRTRDGDEIGVPWTGEVGIPKTTDELMASALVAPPSSRPLLMPERELKRENGEEREELKKQNPESKLWASFPNNKLSKGNSVNTGGDAFAPQPTSTTFLGATLADTGAFPPDTMGAVGPTQFVVFVNGRLRTFNKTTGAADGVVNADPDVFFASVMTPVVAPVLINFTSDPNVRFDRLTNRWFLTIIDVPCTIANCSTTAPNRLLIAVSDAASNGVISGSTVWTFYFVQQDTVGGPSTNEFLDYPSLGIDNNALYVAGNMFGAASGAFIGTSAFVVRKSSVLSGGPIVTTAFRGLIPDPNTTDGMLSPRGVDNYNSTANEGYFIGVSNAAFGRLIMRRIATPGATPTISADILITVSATSFPITVDHLGDTGGTNGNLDALDDRLFAAHIRNGRLWTAHSMAVTAAGVASNSNAARRNGVRWYELVVPVNTGTPTVNQSGTIFDSTAAVASARQYWIPSIMVNGQGHAALGYSTAGTPNRINAATNGRLASDALGTTQAVNIYTASGTAYNPPSDPGGAAGRRWGDYSFVSLDPKDDMTMWTIQEFCSSTNNYGVQVVKLGAPAPPAVLTPSPASTAAGQASVNIVVTGTSVAGTAFYDPGADLAPPATPFTHISASITPPLAPDALMVNSVTYNSPTQVTVNLNTIGASTGVKTLTITNPDGQQTTTAITILAGPTAGHVTASGKVLSAAGMGLANAQVSVTTETGQRQTALTNAFGHFSFNDLLAGQTYIFTVSHKRYTFSNPSQAVNLQEDRDDIIFIADN
jgi:hypothetical protein